MWAISSQLFISCHSRDQTIQFRYYIYSFCANALLILYLNILFSKYNSATHSKCFINYLTNKSYFIDEMVSVFHTILLENLKIILKRQYIDLIDQNLLFRWKILYSLEKIFSREKIIV